MSDQLQNVTAYMAGAGTGKTYQICEKIKEAILRDRTDPDRIIATTFTNKAAAELRNRVKTHLYRESDLAFSDAAEQARRLEEAAIGTVHGLGHRFLKRYAVQLGLSPRLSVLDEDASDRAIDEFLETIDIDRMERLHDAAEPFEVPDVQGVLKQLLAEKRLNNIGHDTFRAQMNRSLDRFLEILAPDGPDSSLPGEAEVRSFLQEKREKLRTLNRDWEYQYVEDYIENVLERALNRGRFVWKTYARLGGADMGGANDRANEIASEVQQYAATIAREHPDLHDQLQTFVDTLADETIRFQEEYRQYKEERGLLDYRDLEVQFLNALHNETVAEDIQNSFDLVLVDEFQDANPIQLAIFLRLHELIGNSFWVGDKKQSIYRFRDADLQLVQDALELLDEESIRSRSKSYRAHAGLISIFNDLFIPVFGEDARLEANRDEQKDVSVERWALDASKNEEEYRTMVTGIQSLLEETFDPGDIAVLTRANYQARQIGEKLDDAGIETVVNKPGLLYSRECAAALSALKITADPRDTAAVAELHHLMEPADRDTPEWIQDRLEQMQEQRAKERDGDHDSTWEESPYVDTLQEISTDERSPRAITAAVIQALDLPDRMGSWGHPDLRSANLDALLEMADQYADEMREKGRGVTLRGFISWADQKRDDEDDERPVIEGADAVTLSTYHSAKGLEWPVVILFGVDSKTDPDPFEPRVTGGNVREGKPLEDRELRYWPWPYGYSRGYFGNLSRVKKLGVYDEAVSTPEGTHLQEKAEEEEKRVYYVAMTRAEERLVITHRGAPGDLPDPSAYSGLADFPMDDVLLPKAEEGRHDLENRETGMRIRHLEPEATDREQAPDQVTDLDVRRPADTDYAGRFTSPSNLQKEPDAVTVSAHSLPGAHPFPDPNDIPNDIDIDHWKALGTAVHTYYAGLPSFRSLDESEKIAIATRCLRDGEIEDVIAPEDLVHSGERLEKWIETNYSRLEYATEVPVTAPVDGSQGQGAMDLLIERPDAAVIVDHKIKPVPEEMWRETARTFAPQMATYRNLLETQGVDVDSCWIHLPLAGGIVKVETPSNSNNAN